MNFKSMWTAQFQVHQILPGSLHQPDPFSYCSPALDYPTLPLDSSSLIMQPNECENNWDVIRTFN